MKYILTILCFLFTAVVHAEKIGSVEYQLPVDLSEKWEIVHQVKKDQSEIVLYMPKEGNEGRSTESFGVSLSVDSKEPLDECINVFKKGVKAAYPDVELEVSTIEKTDNGILFEWCGSEKGAEKFCGLSRVIYGENGAIVLCYQTQKPSEFLNARALWLPVLQEASAE